jgi:hypothetical protein
MSTDTPTLQPGDTLVNTKTDTTLDVKDAADDGALTITDDRRVGTQDGEYDRETIEQAVADGDLQLVRDSELTAITGVGDATAPKLEARTGCRTPDALARAYLTDEDTNVRDAIPRTDYFDQWLCEHADSLDIDATLAEIKVVLFLAEHGCTERQSTLSDTTAVSSKSGSVDPGELVVDHLAWEENPHWVSSSSVVGIGRDHWLTHAPPHLPVGKYEQVDSTGKHGELDEHHEFTVDGGTTVVSGDYLDSLQSLFTFDLGDAHGHPDGNWPIIVYDEETDLSAAIAPRVTSP